jgi:hypothetical protein
MFILPTTTDTDGQSDDKPITLICDYVEEFEALMRIFLPRTAPVNA